MAASVSVSTSHSLNDTQCLDFPTDSEATVKCSVGTTLQGPSSPGLRSAHAHLCHEDTNKTQSSASNDYLISFLSD